MSTIPEEVDLIDYLGTIWRRKWLIVLGTFTCILVVGVVSWLLPPSYQTELILKIGKVSTVEYVMREIMIEDPDNVKTRLMSKPFLFSIIERNQLQLEMKPKDLKAKAEVVSNMVKFSIQARSPEETVFLINSVAEDIIEQHRKKFSEAMNINILRQEELKKQVENTGEEIKELRNALTQIQRAPKVDAPAVILLEANLSEKERLLTELKGMYRRIQLANSPINSENTKVYDPAIKPRSPVSPKKLLNMTIAAVVGLMVTVMLAFFWEHIQDEKGEE